MLEKTVELTTRFVSVRFPKKEPDGTLEHQENTHTQTHDTARMIDHDGRSSLLHVAAASAPTSAVCDSMLHLPFQYKVCLSGSESTKRW